MSSGSSFRIDVRTDNGAVIVALTGELDLNAASGLLGSLDTVVGCGSGDVVFDLALLSFVDSTGVAALLDARERVTALGRRLHVANVGRQARCVFELTGVDAILTGVDSRA